MQNASNTYLPVAKMEMMIYGKYRLLLVTLKHANWRRQLAKNADRRQMLSVQNPLRKLYLCMK